MLGEDTRGRDLASSEQGPCFCLGAMCSASKLKAAYMMWLTFCGPPWPPRSLKIRLK